MTDVKVTEDNEAMRNNVKEQLDNPNRKKKDHVKLSKVWQTTQNIKSIQAELVAGYSFDKDRMNELVNAMFSFINGIVSPKADEDKRVEVTTDEIVKE